MSAFALSLASPSRVSYASHRAMNSLWSFTCAVRSACVFVMCISIASVYVFVNLCVVLWMCRVSHGRRGISVESTFCSRQGVVVFCLWVWGVVCGCGCRAAGAGRWRGTRNPHDGSKLSWGLFLAVYVWVRRTGRRRLRLLR